MATLATAGHTGMNAVTRFARNAVKRRIGVVAGRTLSRHRGVGMESTWVPGHITALVARVAIRTDAHRPVWDMVAGFTVSRRVST